MGPFVRVRAHLVHVRLRSDASVAPPRRVGAAPQPTLAAQLLKALFRCCHIVRMQNVATSQKYPLRLASCLGQLGATDPARVQLPQPPPAPILEDPRDLLAKLLAAVLRIMRTALHLSLVEFCSYALHKLLHLDLCRACPACASPWIEQLLWTRALLRST
jgi:hypothetical protein